MASPPFNPSENLPGDTDVVSQYPAIERAFRDIIESWILVEHGRAGHHNFLVGTTIERDAITDWHRGSLWINSDTNPRRLQFQTNLNPPFNWVTVANMDYVDDTFALKTRAITTANDSGLQGGGNLTADRALSVRFASGAQAGQGTSEIVVMSPATTVTAINVFAEEAAHDTQITGSGVVNNYPIGHVLLVDCGAVTNVTRNGVINVHLHDTNDFQYVNSNHPNAGTVVDGTWRSCGRFTGGSGQVYLVRRTA